MSLLILYAHFHPKDSVSEHTFYTLKQLRKSGGTLCFISSSQVTSLELKIRLEGLCSQILFCENIGYDFFSWRTGVQINRSRIGTEFDEVLFINSSIIGPFYSFRFYLNRLRAVNADLTGAILSFQIQRHIQSFLYYFKGRVLTSDSFFQFWESVLPINDRQQVINIYELGLLTYFEEAGFSVDGLYHGNDRKNHTIRSPFRLFFHGFPFVKIKLLTPKKVKNKVVLFRIILRVVNWRIPKLPDHKNQII